MTFYAFLYMIIPKPLTSNKGSGKVYHIIWIKYLLLILIGTKCKFKYTYNNIILYYIMVFLFYNVVK